MSDILIAAVLVGVACTYLVTAPRMRRWSPTVRERREGVVLYARRSVKRVEVGRVKFDRSSSANPDVPFDEQLAVVVARTRDRCSTLNATRRNLKGR